MSLSRHWLKYGLVASLVMVVILIWSAYQLAPAILARTLGTRPGEFAVRIDKAVPLTTSDGTILVADLYRPLRTGTVPVILIRIPYSRTVTNTLFARIVGHMWAEHGYTVVIQGTRGRYQSGGDYYPFRSELGDGLETLAWLKRQPWFDGRLGMWGGSYFGYTQWVIADQVDPGPQALFIQLIGTDLYRMFYPGGAFSLESALYWAALSHGTQDIEPDRADLERGFHGWPLIEADERTGGDVAFFNEWVLHTGNDSFWQSISGAHRPERLTAPVLLMAGWYDPFLPAQLDDFMRIRKAARADVADASRLIVGPWAHAYTVDLPGAAANRNYRLESLAPSIDWFDLHLQPGRFPAKETAPVRIFVMGENVWRDEAEWPLARTRYINYYLSSNGRANSRAGDGMLVTTPVVTNEPPDQFVYDPMQPVPSAGGAMLGPRAGVILQNHVEARDDVLVYSTTPLQQDVEVTGPVQLILHITTTATSTDFTAKLVDVWPDGSAYNISEGILRRTFANEWNHAAPTPVEIQIELWPTSMLFRRGHRLRLEIASSSFPRFDRNPNTGGSIPYETRAITARQTVFHSSQYPSRLVLPVIPR